MEDTGEMVIIGKDPSGKEFRLHVWADIVEEFIEDLRELGHTVTGTEPA